MNTLSGSSLFFIILMLLLQISQSENISEAKNCTFLKIHKDLHSTTHNIFKMLHINESIKEVYKIKQLSLLNKHLKRLAENKLISYRDISNASKKDVINLTFDGNKEVSETVDQVLNIKVDSNVTIILKYETNTRNTTSEHYEASAESLEFVEDFLNKIDTLTIEDILGPYNKCEEHKIAHTMSELLKEQKSYNVEKWIPSKSSEENSKADTRRLFQGTTTSVTEYPFMVSVHADGVFVCGGSIISKDMIITAASCLEIARREPHSIRRRRFAVRVASNYTNKLGELYTITGVHFHPNFDPHNLKNNIAIVEVNKMKNIPDNRIRRIPLGTREQGWLPRTGTNVRMLGWGDKEADANNQDDPLSLTRLKIYAYYDCRERYTGVFVTNDNFCVGYVDKGGGACNRDIGGPAIAHGALFGIVSFGPPVCGTPNAPTVLTDLTQYLTWINSMLRKQETVKQRLAPKGLDPMGPKTT